MRNLGTIRLVNPYRGRIYLAQVEAQNGILSARTSNFEQFSIYLTLAGSEYYCGRSLQRRELGLWLKAEPTAADDLPQEDEFGMNVANTPDPKSWIWYCISGAGERRLKSAFKPTRTEMQRLAGYALQLNPNNFYPILDNWECWVCDKETLEPLALVMVATSKDDIETATFNPMWQLATRRSLGGYCAEVEEFEKIINARINSATEPGRFRFSARIFERHLDGTSTEYKQDGTVINHPSSHLPKGLLAEPWESDRAKLEQEYCNKLT